MSALADSLARPISRSRAAITDGVGAARVREVGAATAIGMATACAVGVLPVPRLVLVAVICALGATAVMIRSMRLTAVALGVSIPEIQDVSGQTLGLHIAASDVILVLIAIGILAAGLRTRRLPALSALRPVRFLFLQYAWVLVLLLVLHPSLGSAAKSFQRLELLGLPLLVGAFLALRRYHLVVLKAYVVAATVLAVAWPLLNAAGHAGQFDKNPTGQMLANAILVLLAMRGLRAYLVCMPVLVVGLALTASRGAILSVVVGVGVISLFLGSRNLQAVLVRSGLILLIAVGAYHWLPETVTSQVTTYSASSGTAASYPIYIREQFNHDAEHLIAAHPWTGVGVGNYSAGSVSAGTFTDNPHDVLLLQAAEGGYVYLASFVVLIGGAILVVWHRRRSTLAPAAAGVLLATVAHGVVDIYWVRGTPVLGWLLVGMVCGLMARRGLASSV